MLDIFGLSIYCFTIVNGAPPTGLPLALFIVLFGKLLKYVECVVGVAKADILRGVVAEDDWDGLHHSTTSILDMDKVLSGYSR
jgi:hypothetical protein